tara:strand:+ start:1628 stop:1888 length:261 start_codon:yes stop_codon:yes gene_type:complete
MKVTKADHDWLLEHAAQNPDNTWVCKETGADIQYKEVGRSIWIRPFQGGFGEVLTVAHLYCPKCQPDFVAPTSGRPIFEDELVHVF